MSELAASRKHFPYPKGGLSQGLGVGQYWTTGQTIKPGAKIHAHQR
jgi:hypothetical protein